MLNNIDISVTHSQGPIENHRLSIFKAQFKNTPDIAVPEQHVIFVVDNGKNLLESDLNTCKLTIKKMLDGMSLDTYISIITCNDNSVPITIKIEGKLKIKFQKKDSLPAIIEAIDNITNDGNKNIASAIKTTSFAIVNGGRRAPNDEEIRKTRIVFITDGKTYSKIAHNVGSSHHHHQDLILSEKNTFDYIIESMALIYRNKLLPRLINIGIGKDMPYHKHQYIYIKEQSNIELLANTLVKSIAPLNTKIDLIIKYSDAHKETVPNLPWAFFQHHDINFYPLDTTGVNHVSFVIYHNDEATPQILSFNSFPSVEELSYDNEQLKIHLATYNASITSKLLNNSNISKQERLEIINQIEQLRAVYTEDCFTFDHHFSKQYIEILQNLNKIYEEQQDLQQHRGPARVIKAYTAYNTKVQHAETHDFLQISATISTMR